jgi:hypothetical protein
MAVNSQLGPLQGVGILMNQWRPRVTIAGAFPLVSSSADLKRRNSMKFGIYSLESQFDYNIFK